MNEKIFTYALTIKETDLDVFGHVNHAKYLVYFEEARWDFVNQNGYGLKKIIETGLGPVILEANVKYLKELRARDEVVIETTLLSYENKVGKLQQQIRRQGEVCCTLMLSFGLFNVKERKLVSPTEEWRKAIGIAS